MVREEDYRHCMHTKHDLVQRSWGKKLSFPQKKREMPRNNQEKKNMIYSLYLKRGSEREKNGKSY